MNTLSQHLDLRQSQQLVMTPQLQQAIKLLQLNNVELSEYIEEELEKNPLLEKQDSVDQGSDISSQEHESEDAQASKEAQKDDVDSAFNQDYENSDNASVDAKDFDAGSSMADIGAGGNSKFDSTEEPFENRISEEKTLREHLSGQLNVAFSKERDRMIGAFLIDRLDESGYLRDSAEDLSKRFGCSLEQVKNLLVSMKQFDPTGVFAGDLSECLCLQLEERGQLDAPMRILIDNLQMLADHDFKKLADLCGANDTYLMDMVAEVKALNPKPAGLFDHFVVQTAVPDVLMRKLPKNIGGGWRVELNNETLPRVLVNQEYYTKVSENAARSKNKKDREYVTTQLASANWLVRSLEQRAKTILKVSSEIVEQQDAFFNYGIEFLKPLTLKDIAECVEVHESTVSRVTTNKYIGTPRGIFELKFFFSTGIVSQSGIVHSAEAIKARIKSLINEEEPKKVLSDDKIVETLHAEGIDLARRTVAKYREAMHIGSSVQRRKQKKNLESSLLTKGT
ncbi:MAG: RNA polymerase factor sigma-54 [Alphaproteobacteria bacterium]|nr:RNA polymerase factor sigma-54 [Alphaproteobacteria bacterium]